MKNKNGWHTLRCLYCNNVFGYRISKEKKKAMLNGYSIDIQCSKCRCTGMVSAETFDLKCKEGRNEV